MMQFNGESKFDNISSDAQEFRKLAEHILSLIADKAIKNTANQHILCFVASGLIDSAESAEEYIEGEVRQN